MPTSKSQTFANRSLTHLTVHLPQVLIINGGRQGRAGLNTGPSNIHDPVFYPALYNPQGQNGSRWTNLATQKIARLYHSLAILGPDSCLLIGGSSPYDCCLGCGPQCFKKTCDGSDDECYPNEFTIQNYCPPYVSSTIPQPVIGSAPLKIGYGVPFEVTLNIRSNLTLPAVRAAIVNPGFGECPSLALANSVLKYKR